MKKLLFTLLLLPLLTGAYAQNDTDQNQDFSIELKGGMTWRETRFQISIRQKGTKIYLKYKLMEEHDRERLKKDSVYKALKAKYEKMPNTLKDDKKMSAEMMSILDRSRTTYQDSLAIEREYVVNQKLALLQFQHLLKFVAAVEKEKFDGGLNMFTDGDFLSCKINYKGQTTEIWKNAPLSIDSPLLYVFLNETLKVGSEANSKAALKIAEIFKYLF